MLAEEAENQRKANTALRKRVGKSASVQRQSK